MPCAARLERASPPAARLPTTNAIVGTTAASRNALRIGSLKAPPKTHAQASPINPTKNGRWASPESRNAPARMNPRSAASPRTTLPGSFSSAPSGELPWTASATAADMSRPAIAPPTMRPTMTVTRDSAARSSGTAPRHVALATTTNRTAGSVGCTRATASTST